MIAGVARLLSTSLTIQEAARHVFEQSLADETAAFLDRCGGRPWLNEPMTPYNTFDLAAGRYGVVVVSTGPATTATVSSRAAP